MYRYLTQPPTTAVVRFNFQLQIVKSERGKCKITGGFTVFEWWGREGWIGLGYSNQGNAVRFHATIIA